MPPKTKRRSSRRSSVPKLSRLLLAARLKAGQTKSDAASQMRAVPNSINNWENGMRPNQAAWPFIASYIGVPLEDVERLAGKRQTRKAKA